MQQALENRREAGLSGPPGARAWHRAIPVGKVELLGHDVGARGDLPGKTRQARMVGGGDRLVRRFEGGAPLQADVHRADGLGLVRRGGQREGDGRREVEGESPQAQAPEVFALEVDPTVEHLALARAQGVVQLPHLPIGEEGEGGVACDREVALMVDDEQALVEALGLVPLRIGEVVDVAQIQQRLEQDIGLAAPLPGVGRREHRRGGLRHLEELVAHAKTAFLGFEAVQDPIGRHRDLARP
ncbi:hypothetical protein D3C86_1102240 [compost metagenome]